jgi:hypothetical protein
VEPADHVGVHHDGVVTCLDGAAANASQALGELLVGQQRGRHEIEVWFEVGEQRFHTAAGTCSNSPRLSRPAALSMFGTNRARFVPAHLRSGEMAVRQLNYLSLCRLRRKCRVFYRYFCRDTMRHFVRIVSPRCCFDEQWMHLSAARAPSQAEGRSVSALARGRVRPYRAARRVPARLLQDCSAVWWLLKNRGVNRPLWATSGPALCLLRARSVRYRGGRAAHPSGIFKRYERRCF